MRRLLALTLVALAACTGAKTPSKEDAAAYYGLQDGRELTFDVTAMGLPNTTAKHIFHKNESFADELGFSREQRNQGNLIEETLVFASRLEEMVLMRDGDCLPNCTDYGTPPVIFKNPTDPNTNWSTESVTTIRSASGNASGKELHEIQVGAEFDVTTAAGTFKAMQLTWRTLFPDDSTKMPITRVLYFAPSKGVVQFQRDTRTYKLNTGVSP